VNTGRRVPLQLKSTVANIKIDNCNTGGILSRKEKKNMAINSEKRRYAVTLTPANVDRFQNLCKRLKLPASTMSAAIDDTIRDLCGVLQISLDKGTTGIGNLFKEKQQEMELLLHQEQKEKNDGMQKRKKKASS
jgi:phosphoribosylformylglycinamidine (FGAM) synthase-like enzyme